MANRITVSISLPPELQEDLDALADAERESRSVIVRQALRHHITRNKHKLADKEVTDATQQAR